jgi:hypothetical protein
MKPLKPLSEQQRHRRVRMKIFAKEAARHFLKHNEGATDEAADRFASRAWRLPEFIQVAADCLALEDEAAPNN